MPVIEIKNDLPGIAGLLTQYPVQGAALSQLAQTLLRGPSSLTEEEREMIAVAVSYANATPFCMNSHKEAGIALHKKSDGNDISLVKTLVTSFETGKDPEFSDRIYALLTVVGCVINNLPLSFNNNQYLEKFRSKGITLTDDEIHDTVLVTASFCMFNRYVKCLDTKEATPEQYQQMGEKLATQGYL
jgi:AhpD family alkylhydroperoxidase